MKESYKLLVVYAALLVALIIAIFGLYQWVVWDHDKLYEAAQKEQQKEFDQKLPAKLSEKGIKLGELNSAHAHTDFKVVLAGEELNFNQQKYFVKSAYAHVEPDNNPEDTGRKLHVHASNVPLWVFFESVGMKFNSSCFVLGQGTTEEKAVCKTSRETLRLFVNGKENYQFEDYVPQDRDRILIIYGTIASIGQQLKSMEW